MYRMINDVTTLPDNPQILKQMISELLISLQEKERKIGRLENSLSEMIRQRFGKKSERLEDIDPALLLPFISEYLKTLEPIKEEVAEEPAGKETKIVSKKPGHGRRKLPQSLDRERIVHDIAEEEKTCKCCGNELSHIGEDISEQLEFIPAKLHVIEHARQKYACKSCQGNVIVADKARQPIEKGLAAAGLLTHVAISKYADHQPLYRLEGILKRHHIDISRSTMCGWMANVAELLTPLYNEMKKCIIASKVINTDDTTVQVQDDNQYKKTKTGRLWIYRGDENQPFNVYEYTPTRQREGPQTFLRDFKNGFLQADAYAGYDCIFNDSCKNIKELLCWAHARRKFYEARKYSPQLSHSAIAMIKLLYEIENKIKDLCANEKREIRQSKSVPILNDIKDWLQSITLAQALPQSPIRNAINYTLNGFEALCRYCEDGDFNIDNNAAEQLMRPIALGRKNWLFFGSDKGGHTAAVIATIIQSAKRHGLNLYEYLKAIISQIADHPAHQIHQLLPNNWQSIQ